MKLLFIIFLCFCSVYSSSQNLVPNSSFEEKNALPNLVRVWSIKDWCGANAGPGDYYYPNNPDKIEGVPENIFGKQESHTGNAYTGICITSEYAEYIEAELVKPLTKGQEYKISFFISKADKKWHACVKEMGVLFLPKKKTWFLARGIDKKPDVDFINEKGYKNEDDWVELSETYIARGDESVLVLGHFLYNEPNGFNGKAHYYIDDVSITPVNDDYEKEGIATKSIPITTTENEIAPVSIDTFRLQDLNFKFGTAILEGNYDVLLSEPVNFLLRYPKKAITVEGYTDNIGNEEKNQKLSEERAKAIADYLIQKRVDKTHIACKGYGSLRPIAGNDTEEGRHKNRRVEIIVH